MNPVNNAAAKNEPPTGFPLRCSQQAASHDLPPPSHESLAMV